MVVCSAREITGKNTNLHVQSSQGNGYQNNCLYYLFRSFQRIDRNDCLCGTFRNECTVVAIELGSKLFDWNAHCSTSL